MRRHLVKKPSRTQGGRGSPGGLAPTLRRKKKKKKLDRRPHEVRDPSAGHISFLWPLLPEPPFPLLPAVPWHWVPPGGPQTLILGAYLRCLWS